jgi:uncharacterized protein YjbI with pentapeptide repeats
MRPHPFRHPVRWLGDLGAALRRSPALALTLLTVATVLGILLLFNPVSWWLGGDTVSSLSGKDRAEAIDAVRKTLLQGFAASVAVAALAFTARTYWLSREGQVTDRYTKAIDQLGSSTLAQRIGGVFALERILRDSAKDHAAVVDVLAAFIKVQSRAEDPGARSSSGRPGADVQTALLVLGRRPARPEREIDRLRLSGSDLQRTVARRARLDRAALRYTNLVGIHWENSSLVGTSFRLATLTGADLRGADLRHTSFERADLTDADLSRARLDHAAFDGATLQGAVLTLAHLSGATHTQALTPTQLDAVHCRPESLCTESVPLPRGYEQPQ